MQTESLPLTVSTRSSRTINGGPALRDLVSLLDSTGTSILNVAAYYIDQTTTVADFRPVFETAATLQAKFVCVSGYDQNEDRFSEKLAELAESAKHFGLSLALEFVPYSQCRTLVAANNAITKSGTANVQILLDMLHFMRSGSSIQDLKSTPPERFGFFQICDGPSFQPPPDALAEEARNTRLLPGEGAFPLKEVLEALPCAIQIEIETPNAAIRHLPYEEQALVMTRSVTSYLNALSI